MTDEIVWPNPSLPSHDIFAPYYTVRLPRDGRYDPFINWSLERRGPLHLVYLYDRYTTIDGCITALTEAGWHYEGSEPVVDVTHHPASGRRNALEAAAYGEGYNHPAHDEIHHRGKRLVFTRARDPRSLALRPSWANVVPLTE